MGEKVSIMAVSADKSVRKKLRNQLEQMEHVNLTSVVKSTDEVARELQTTRLDILILGLSEKAEQTLRWLDETKESFPNTAVFVTSVSKAPELVISAMRAGAQEFLSQPIVTTDLIQAIDRVRKARTKFKAKAPIRGKIISVFSKKGGLGVTSLAVNLAVALSHESEEKAALIDLDLQLGDVTSFLNLSPEYNILDCLNQDGGVDAVKLQSCMTRHESGVYVLPEPKNPADADNVGNSHINQILNQLKSMFSYVIVDLSHVFDSRNLEVFELSDSIILVSVPNISSIRAAKKALGVFKEMGYLQGKVRLVINRVGKKESISMEQIEKTLHFPVSWVIPNNYPVVIDAINSGVPLTNHRSVSNVSKSIAGLAKDIPRWSRTLYVEIKD
jgi:pilus assembly protein CpaE